MIPAHIRCGKNLLIDADYMDEAQAPSTPKSTPPPSVWHMMPAHIRCEKNLLVDEDYMGEARDAYPLLWCFISVAVYNVSLCVN